MTERKRGLKSLYSRGKFGPGFIEAAQEELPALWGRLSLLEEFYRLNAPGQSERSRVVAEQLGRPAPRKGLWERVRLAFSD